MSEMIKKYAAITILAILALSMNAGCEKQHHTSRAFYYWKTTASFTENDYRFFKDNKIQTLYLRYFDVSWDTKTRKPVPVSVVSFGKKSPLPVRITPVVFITQETLEKIEPKDIDNLAKNIATLISTVSRDNNISGINEIQLDCDWTTATRSAYFGLIKRAAYYYKQREKNVRISATIRLHQIKYMRETGIPPVDRGTLMVYNTGSLQNLSDKNTILDNPTARGYLHNLENYPLPLDIALPMFSWAIQFDSNKKFIRLIDEIQTNDLKTSTDFQPLGETLYMAQKDTMLNDKRIMNGDLVKIDTVSFDQVMEIGAFLKNKQKTNAYSIILFHYDPNVIKEFTHGKTGKLSDLFTIF